MAYKNVRLEWKTGIARLSLNRPPLHILDTPTLDELGAALDEIKARADVPVCVLSGTGEKAFSAGAEVSDHTPDKVGPMLAAFHRVIRTLYTWDKVSLASIRGHCLGGGMELAMACDIVFAAEGARFGQPEIALACFPPVAAALYPRLCGWRRASYLCFTGEPISAGEAYVAGLVNRVVTSGDLDPAVEETARTIAQRSPASLAWTRRAMRVGREEAFEEALREAERLYHEGLMKTEDAREGIAAFIEKRKPTWKGR